MCVCAHLFLWQYALFEIPEENVHESIYWNQPIFRRVIFLSSSNNKDVWVLERNCTYDFKKNISVIWE